MENFKKFASSLIAFMMVATSTLSGLVHAQGALIDDPEFDSALEWMYSNGMTQYSTQEDFMPFNTLTREQAAKFYSEFAESELGLERDADAECDFEDLDESDPSLTNSIVKACEMGLIKGDGNEFLPKQEFTRAQAFTVLVRATVGDQSEDVNPWWANYFDVAQEQGYTVETDVYGQDRATQRYEVALMLYRASEDSEDTEADDGDDLGDLEDIIGGIIGDEDEEDTQDEDTQDEDTQDEDTEDEDTEDEDQEDEETEYDVEEGMVEVALNPSSPSDQSIPGTGRVTYATIDVAAGDSDVAVDSIELTREGLGSRSDISRVWLERDNYRVSSRQTVGRDNTVDLRMDRDFVVQAGDVASLDLVVEMEAGGSAGNEHNFVIESEDAIQADGEVVGNFPIRTGVMTTSSYAVSQLDITSAGVGDSYDVGESDVLFGEFEVLNDSDEEEVELRRITFRQSGNGDVEASLDNLGLYSQGQEISRDVITDGRDITFVVDKDSDYNTIDSNSTEYLEIRADVIGAEFEEGDDYQFEIRRSSDVYAVETRTQFAAGINVDNLELEEYTVEGGELLIRRDTDYSRSETIAPGTNNAVLLSADMTVNNPIVVEDGVTLTGTLDSEDGTNSEDADELGEYVEEVFSSLRLVVDGRTVGSYTPNASDDGIIEFESTFDIDDNANIQLQGNVRSNINTDDLTYDLGEYTFQIDDFSAKSFTDARYLSNDNSAKNEIKGSIEGVRATVERSELTLTRNDNLEVTEDVVAGAKDVKVYGFRLRESDVSDTRLTRVNLSSVLTGVTDSDIQNVRLYREGELLDTNSSGDFDFNSLNVDVEQNERVNFEVVVDFASSIAEGDEFKIDGIANMRARDLASNSVMEYEEGNNAITDKGSDLEGSTFVFAKGGDLEISLSSDRAISSILAPGSETKQVHKLQFEGENDELKVTDITFENDLYSTGTDTVESAVAASVTTGGLNLTADTPGVAGNDIELVINVTNVASGSDTASDDSNTTVSVTDKLITVDVLNDVDTSTDGGNADVNEQTVQNLVDAINGNANASSLVTASVDTAGNAVAVTQTSLTGGQDAVTTTNDLDFTRVLRDAELVIGGTTYDSYFETADEIEFDNIDADLEANELTDVELRLSFNDSSEGARYDKTLQLSISEIEYDSDATGETFDGNDVDLTNTSSRVHRFARSYPIVSMGSNSSTTQEVEVAADENRRVYVEELTVDITGDVDLTNASDLTLYANDTQVNTTSVDVAGDKVTFDFTDDEQISAGDDVTFEIRELQNVQLNGDNDDTMYIKATGMEYNTDTSDTYVLDTSDNEYTNTGIPTSSVTLTY